VDTSSLTREERDLLVSRVRDLDRLLYPPPEAPQPSFTERASLREAYYAALGEYFDRLPRLVLSLCPFSRLPVVRAFDPYGLDGPWWHKDLLTDIQEPAAPPSFKVLLGALALRGRTPSEAGEEVIPGPDVPFVVPRLLALPGMAAVVGEVRLVTGDIAYPVAYFSDQDLPPAALHQPWLRQQLWFLNDEGSESWVVANDLWDFDLEPYIAAGRLFWLREKDGRYELLGADSGERCPYVDLPGDRQPQMLISGTRELMELPDGEPLDPFAD
jgi:hypothetical protein